MKTGTKNTKSIMMVCCMLASVFAMSSTIVSPLLTEFGAEFSIEKAQLGILFTVNNIGYILMLLTAGVISDMFGRKPVALLCCIGFSASLLFFAQSRSIYSALLFMLLIGGFGGALSGMMASLVSELNKAKSSLYLGIFYGSYGLGAAIGPLIALLAFSTNLSWRFCYYIIMALSVISTVLFTFVKLPLYPSVGRINIFDLVTLLRDKKLLLICICLIFCTGSEVASWGWLSTFLKQDFNFSIKLASIAVSVFWIFMTIGRLLFGFLSLRFSDRSLIIFLTASTSLATIIFSMILKGQVLWVLIALLGFFYSAQFSLILSYGSKENNGANNRLSATTFALMVSSGAAGNILLPYMMGLAGQWFGTRIAIISTAPLLISVMLIFIITHQKKIFRL